MAALARMLTTAPADDATLEAIAAQVSERWTTEGTVADDGERLGHVAGTAELVTEMLGIPAQGLAGLRAKAVAAAWCTGKPGDIDQEAPDDLYGQALHSIARDLLALPSATIHPFPRPAATPAAPAASELLRVAAEFAALKADHAEVVARVVATTAAAEALHPRAPAMFRDHTGQLIGKMELRYLDETTIRKRAAVMSGAHVEELTHWQAQVDAIDSSFGLPGLEEAAERAAEAEDKAANRVSAMRPANIREAVVKYAVLLASWADRERDEVASARVFFDFLTDLEALTRTSD